MAAHLFPPGRSEKAALSALEPEAMLVAAIVRQAIRAARNARLQRHERVDARAFLLGGGMLPGLCDLLGIAPDAVTRCARSMLSSGDAPPRWRQGRRRQAAAGR
jgi:hypothetical protein